MVSFEHSEYREHKKQVKLVNSVFMGSDNVAEYLVQFPQEASNNFEERKKNIAVKNFVKRATEAFIGMIFRKQITTSGYSNKVNSLFKNIDNQTTLNQFARELASNLILDGKGYILVDNDTIDTTSNPYFVALRRSSVINWKKDKSGKFTLVVVKETVKEDATGSIFETIDVEQYRVFLENGDIELWRANSDGELVLYEPISTGINYIPIVELNLAMTPPLYDIAKLNIKHINRTSAKDRYLDMSACPVPVIWGADIDTDGEVASAKPALVIGVDEAFIFTGTKDECDFQWRELTGSSISELQKDLAVIESDITSGVIRASQTNSSQAAKTATQAYYESAEASNRVSVIANVVEYALNNATNMLIDYLGEPKSISSVGVITVNKDYNAIGSDSGQVRLLWEMYLGGALSIDTLLRSIEQYEMATIGDVTTELEKIKNSTFVPTPVETPKATVKKTDKRTLSMTP